MAPREILTLHPVLHFSEIVHQRQGRGFMLPPGHGRHLRPMIGPHTSLRGIVLTLNGQEVNSRKLGVPLNAGGIVSCGIIAIGPWTDSVRLRGKYPGERDRGYFFFPFF